MLGLVSNIIRCAGRTLLPITNFRAFHALPTTISNNATVTPQITNAWSIIPLRTIIRDNFRKQKEIKRLRILGFRTKFKTRSGRRTLMRRILKGRFYIAH